MPIVNNQESAELLFKKIEKELRTYKCFHFGEIMFGEHNGVYSITVECDEPRSVGDIVHTLINKDKRARVTGSVEHKGHFDWSADTYIKDASLVFWKY